MEFTDEENMSATKENLNRRKAGIQEDSRGGIKA